MTYKGRGAMQITGRSQDTITLGAVGAGSGLSISPNLSLNSIGQLSGIQLGNLTASDTFERMFSNEQISRNIKKYEVYESAEDLLVLSVVWHKIRKNNKDHFPRPTSLTDNYLFQNIESVDRERATEIRDYYSKKLMMFTLKEQQLSAFRKDLSSFVHSDGKIFKESMMPLVYRLPEFHEYDVGFDEMSFGLTKQFNKPEDRFTEQTLQPLKKLVVKNRTGKYNEYWLKDNIDRLYKIDIPLDNKLSHLWEHFFLEKHVPIIGNYRYREKDNINYFEVKNWEINFSLL